MAPSSKIIANTSVGDACDDNLRSESYVLDSFSIFGVTTCGYITHIKDIEVRFGCYFEDKLPSLACVRNTSVYYSGIEIPCNNDCTVNIPDLVTRCLKFRQ